MNFESLEKRDGSLKENWYIACLASELGSRKPVSREIYDQSLVLFRDEKGKVHCLPNRCLHRNARLSEGVILPGGKLGCPYHGWVYSGDGRVLEVPSRGPGSPPLSLCHRSFPAIEQDGCVWIWMGSQPPPGPPPFRFPSHELSSWNSYFMITDFENEVGNLAENFMDVPHTIFVHKGWFRDRKSTRLNSSHT